MNLLLITILWTAFSTMCNSHLHPERNSSHLYEELPPGETNDVSPSSCSIAQELLNNKLEDATIFSQYETSQEFMFSGNLSLGLTIVNQCLDAAQDIQSNIDKTFELCNDTSSSRAKEIKCEVEKFSKVCWFFSGLYQLTKQLESCREIENQYNLFSRSENSVYSIEYLKSKYIKEITKFFNSVMEFQTEVNTYNLTYILNSTFIFNFTNTEAITIIEDGVKFHKELKEYRLILYYIYGPIHILLFILGMIGNGVLLLIFLRHKKVRTSQNLLLLNLAIGDVLNLTSNLLYQYIVEIMYENHLTYFSDATCKTVVTFQSMSYGLSIYAVVSLSVQRFIFISKSSRRYRQQHISKKTITFLNILIVWFLSFGFAFPILFLMTSDYFGICFIKDNFYFTLWHFLYGAIVPLVIVMVMYILTARRLARSVKHLPGEMLGQETLRQSRHKSAKVLVGLTIVFVCSYLPYFLYIFLFSSKIIQHSVDWLDYFLYQLIFLNPVINPVALYFSSGMFKKYFKMYLLRCNPSVSIKHDTGSNRETNTTSSTNTTSIR